MTPSFHDVGRANLSLHRKVRVERVAFLGATCRLAALASAFAIFAAAAGMAGQVRGLAIGAWVAVMLGLSLVTLWFHHQMTAPGLDAERAERLEHTFAARTAFAGIGWGLLVFFLPRESDSIASGWLAILVLTMGMAATGTLAVSRMCFMAFTVPAIAPLAGFFIVNPPAGFPFAGWGILVYLVFLFGMQDLLRRMLQTTLRKRLESEALAQEQQVIFDTAAQAIVFVRGTHIVKCNLRFLEQMHCRVEEAIGSPMWVWHALASDWTAHSAEALAQSEAGKPYTYIAPMRRLDGSIFRAELTGMPVNPARPAEGMVWMGSDISGRLETEVALRVSENRFRRLVSMSSDLYWEQDEGFRFTHMSGAALTHLAHPAQSLLGKARWEIPGIQGVAPDQWARHRAQLEAHQPFRDFVYHVVDEAGVKHWFTTSGSPMFDEQGRFAGYHGIATDISERIRSAERYRHLAYHDSLTGLPNRRLLSDRLEQSIVLARRRGGLVALMLLDLDDFKIINDTDGHAVGDAVLATIAHRLRLAVREADTVARLGGDEFVVLLPEIETRDAAAAVARKVIDAVREPVQSDNREYLLGVSIGLSLFPIDGETGDRLLQRADAAMYQAKQAGGQRAVFASGEDAGTPVGN